jgi:23S rRNA pseudouridine2605 synthase
MEERLQKIIARAGLASRRRAEEMITSGLVTVNGKLITELGSKADVGRDHIKVAGKLLPPEAESAHVYVVMNKPIEVVATMSDPEGRKTLRDFLHGIPERVFPVGRLEYHSSGLVFLTNDGDLANRMLKARNLPQTYQFKVKSLLTFAEIEQLSRSTGARISRIQGKDQPWYIVTLPDASRDVLRGRLFNSGHAVEKMRRVGLAGVDLGSLQPGEHRPVSAEELSKLRKALAGGTGPSAPPIRPPLVSAVTQPKPSKSDPRTRAAFGAKPVPWQKSGGENKPGNWKKPYSVPPRSAPAQSQFGARPGGENRLRTWNKPNAGAPPSRPTRSGPGIRPGGEDRPRTWSMPDSSAPPVQPNKPAPWKKFDREKKSSTWRKPASSTVPGQPAKREPWKKFDRNKKPGNWPKSDSRPPRSRPANSGPGEENRPRTWNKPNAGTPHRPKKSGPGARPGPRGGKDRRWSRPKP